MLSGSCRNGEEEEMREYVIGNEEEWKLLNQEPNKEGTINIQCKLLE